MDFVFAGGVIRNGTINFRGAEYDNPRVPKPSNVDFGYGPDRAALSEGPRRSRRTG